MQMATITVRSSASSSASASASSCATMSGAPMEPTTYWTLLGETCERFGRLWSCGACSKATRDAAAAAGGGGGGGCGSAGGVAGGIGDGPENV